MQNKWSYGKIVFSVLLVITFVIVGIITLQNFPTTGRSAS